jgi:predicted kinase
VPLLIVFGGLPGTGKTTLSRELARRQGAIYLRVDAIEQSLKAAGLAVGATGYDVANGLALENLKLDRDVIADCVNPVLASRIAWRETALRSAARLVEIEVICSDAVQHRRRVEGRAADIEGLIVPSWGDVVARLYEPWDRDRIVLDTAGKPVDQLIAAIENDIRRAAQLTGNA